MTDRGSAVAAVSEFRYRPGERKHAHAYLQPALARLLDGLDPPPRRVFDLGCGNGATARWLAARGLQVAGADPSTSGIREANRAAPELDLRVGSAYDPLAETFGTFPVVVSLEVVEHVYAPRDYARCVFHLLEPGGAAFVSTPYHGYLKNLALAATGRLDAHFTALWDHGHIKFWSPETLSALLTEAGLEVERVVRVGRVPALAKSMIVVARKPS